VKRCTYDDGGRPGVVSSGVDPMPQGAENMAKKRAEKPAMPVATEAKTKAVRLDLDPDVHQMLRVVSAEKAKPMAIFAREIVEKTVRELYGKRGTR
jgi:hypothetical protein